MLFEEILVLLGDFGKFQKIQYFLACTAAVILGVHNTLLVYTIAEPKHRCRIPGLENDTWDNPDTELVDKFIPRDSKNVSSQCDIYINGTLGSRTACPGSWVYDHSEFSNNFVTEFNLVCTKQGFITWIFQTYVAGVLVGAISSGWIADKIGRKLTLTVCGVMTGIVGLATTLAFDPFSMLAFKFFTGVFGAGTFAVAFVLGMEFIGPDMRLNAGMIIEYFYGSGVVGLAGVAYTLRDWRWLQIAVSAPCLLTFLFLWFLPESPRWLISVQRYKDAEKILRKAAQVNKVVLPQDLNLQDEVDLTDSSNQKQENFLDVLKSRILLPRMSIIFYQWLVVAMVYFGLTYSSGNFPGDIYMNSFLSGLSEIPGFVAAHLTLNRVGRRLPHCAAMLMSGVTLISTIFLVLYAQHLGLDWVFILLAMLGKLAIACAFAIVFIWTAELLPTSLRSTGVGVSSMFGRIGSLISPLIANIKFFISSQFGEALPLMIFGISALSAGVLAFFLPETLGKLLPESIADCENNGTVDNDETKIIHDDDVDSEYGDTTDDRSPL